MSPKHKEYALDLLAALFIAILLLGGAYTLGLI